MNIPHDADGDAMRRVIADGADITRPMTVDFQIDCPDLASAKSIAAKVPPSEFAITIYQDTEDFSVTCECKREMLLDHSELVRIQQQLTDIAKQFGGSCEAWGTVGNN
jgi:Regulator of ribonuclease activity B